MATEPTIIRMPHVEKRGSTIVLTCSACGNFIPVSRELEMDDGMRELHYDCACGGTSCIVREVR